MFALVYSEAAKRVSRRGKHRRYNSSKKGRARSHRYNRTSRRLRAQRERNQVRREALMRREILTLARRP
jgi:hypothetical protein